MNYIGENMAALCRFMALVSFVVLSVLYTQAAGAQTPDSTSTPVPTAAAEDTSYMDLIKKAHEKDFNISKDEYELLMKAAKERVKVLEDDLGKAGKAAWQASIPDEGHDRMIDIEVVRTEKLVKDKENKVTLRLTYQDNNEPVTADHLQTFHTKIIHLMVNEPTLNDYRHSHPMPSDVPGEYVVTIIPKTDCSYRMWADLFPTDGPEQTAQADLPGMQDCSDQKVTETESMSAEHNGLKYVMSMSTKELAKDQDTMVYFDVMSADGKAFMGLEPVMGAYAHLVGFRGDYEGIAHVHPMGEEPTSSADRGGPTLEFHLRPAEAGYMRFFLQVLIGGKDVYIPFGVQIAEQGEHSNEDIFMEMKGTMPDHDAATDGDASDGHEAEDAPAMDHEAMGH